MTTRSFSFVLLTSIALVPFAALAEIDLGRLEGTWVTKCTQTQVHGKQGTTIDTLEWARTSDASVAEFKSTRAWYQTADCSGDVADQDIDVGTVKIGKENTNNGFNPAGTYEADFTSKDKTDLGLIWVSADYKKLRLSRGFIVKSRNTMLGLFEFAKEKNSAR